MELVKVKEEVTEEVWEGVKIGVDLVTIKSEVIPKFRFEEIDIKEEGFDPRDKLEDNPDKTITEAKDTENKIYKYNFHLAGNCKNEHTEASSSGIGLTSFQELQVPGTLIRSSSCHTDKKPFECNVCNYKSVSKGHLVRHMRSHTGEKPFKCNICHYKTSRKESLTNHMRNHTGETPFGCTICEYKTTAKRNLIRHMCNHTGEKPFGCNICNFKCMDKRSLLRHNISTHSD